MKVSWYLVFARHLGQFRKGLRFGSWPRKFQFARHPDGRRHRLIHQIIERVGHHRLEHRVTVGALKADVSLVEVVLLEEVGQ